MTASQTEPKAEAVFPDMSRLSDADLFALEILSEKRERGHALSEDETALFTRLDARIEFVSRDELSRREAVFRPTGARPDTQNPRGDSMTEAEIQTEIDNLNARRAQVKAQFDAQRVAVTTVRAGLVAGTNTPGDVADAVSQFEALQVALDTLDRQLKDAQAALKTAQAKAAHDANIAACVQLVTDAAATRSAFDTAFAETCSDLQTNISTLINTSDSLAASRFEVEQRLHLTGATNADLELVKALAGADVVAVVLAWGARRPNSFDVAQNASTSIDVELALNRAFEVRAAANRRQINTPSYGAEPGTTR